MPRLLQRWLLTLLLTSLTVLSAQAQTWSVVVVSSDKSAAYQEASTALVAELERLGLASNDILQVTAAELVASSALSPRLYVSMGSEAAQTLMRLAPKAPVLFTLIPRMGFERLLAEQGRRASAQLSAIYINQPLGRQLDLVRLALPQARRLGVLLGPESAVQLAQLEADARQRNFKLTVARVSVGESVFPGLKSVLEDSDLLMALADPQIYNSNSIQNILLSSFRARVPMAAFSPSYVRAGALVAVSSSPAQIGRQAAEIAESVIKGKALPEPQYPREFSVNVNEQVARSLGLELNAAELTQRLQRMEKSQ
jgi:putative tryptophan/tyrosine transport system substrate-binding protein